MKTKTLRSISWWVHHLCLSFVVASASGQTAFQNLDFEAAHDLPASGGIVATSNALPGWTAAVDSSLLSTVWYNVYGGVPYVGLYSDPVTLSGNLSVLLSRGGQFVKPG